MKNADMPAMPTTFYEEPRRPTKPGVYDKRTVGGVTKREEFAKAAMVGLLASSVNTDAWDTAAAWQKDIIESAVGFADALLAELERTQ